MKYIFPIFFFVWFSAWNLAAQRYAFKNYKVEEGLVNNETYDILQDSKNRIWIATMGGVSCFNGSNFTNYTTENGLVSNIVFEVFEDSKGRIWAGTLNNGISIIANSEITNPTGIDFSIMGSITSFLEAKDGTIYVFFAKGIGIYKNGTLNYLVKPNKDTLIYNFQSADWYDQNTIYLATSSNGIFKLTLNPFKLENIYNQSNGINNICYTVYIDDSKTVWVGGYGELNKIVDEKLTTYKFNPNEFDDNRVYGISEENENELFLGFEGNGIGFFNKQTGTLKIIDEKNGLPSKYIYRIIKDREGNHWMTSFGEGIIRFRDTGFKIYDDSQGLPSKSVNDVVVWNGKWVAATNAGIVAIDKDQKITPLTKNIPIHNLIRTNENTLLYNTDEKVWELSKNAAPKLVDAGVYNLLYQDEKGTYLFESNRIKVLAKDSTYYIRYKKPIGIVPIGNGYILCKIEGLHQLMGGKIDTIPGINPKTHYNFRSISAINKNEVIVGSDKKLYHIALSDGAFKIKSFDLDRLTPLKNFRALKVDGNSLWLAGRDMLTKIDLKRLLQKDSIVATHYRTTEHFLENDIDLNSLSITDDHTILATSLSGLLVFNEAEYLPNSQPPKLNISQVLLFSEELNDSLYQTEQGIKLPYQKNYLTFKMEAITFTNPENVKYRYRMKGLRDGDEWSLPTQDSKVVFSYLPPGSYTFEFTADNGDGVWQSVPYEYSFTITVPLWKTWMFWAGILSVFSLSIFLYYYLKNKAEQKRNEVYTHNLIKAQEEERTRVARELHDSVGQKLMLLTKKTKSTGYPEMEILASNTLEELRSISRGLHPATLERLGPTVAIRNLINEIDANTTIFFTHEIDEIDTFLTKEASLHLYRIIQEVLNNMVKHAEAKAATITIEKNTNFIEAIISDNGKGFDHSEKLKTSNSLGMKTLLERAKILHSKIEIKSQPNKGTTVTLTIPI